MTARRWPPRARRCSTTAACQFEGGFNREDGPLTSAELYDPGDLAAPPRPEVSRCRAASRRPSRLQDGRSPAAGSNEDGPIGTAEIYDPASGTFSRTTGDLVHPIEDRGARAARRRPRARRRRQRRRTDRLSDLLRRRRALRSRDRTFHVDGQSRISARVHDREPAPGRTHSRRGRPSHRGRAGLRRRRRDRDLRSRDGRVRRAAKTCLCRSTSLPRSCSTIGACCCSAVSISTTICRPRAPSTSRPRSPMTSSLTASIPRDAAPRGSPRGFVVAETEVAQNFTVTRPQ